MGNIGMQELIIIFVIALIIFGPRRLPDLGKSLGKSIAEFKRASNELRNTLEEEIRVDDQQKARAATQWAPTPAQVQAPAPSPVAPAVSVAPEPAPVPAQAPAAAAPAAVQPSAPATAPDNTIQHG
jgi:Tat protein translocase TatB subunit